MEVAKGSLMVVGDTRHYMALVDTCSVEKVGNAGGACEAVGDLLAVLLKSASIGMGKVEVALDDCLDAVSFAASLMIRLAVSGSYCSIAI